MKNIIFSRRNLDFNFVNLEQFSVISELLRSFRTRLHVFLYLKQSCKQIPVVFKDFFEGFVEIILKMFFEPLKNTLF